MFDFNSCRRLSSMVQPLPEGLSAACIMGAPESPEPGQQFDELKSFFLWRPYLEQRWGDESQPLLLYVLMNPSSADADFNDDSTRKCSVIAQAHGFGGMIITEVWALRSTRNEWLLSEEGAAGEEMNYLQLFTHGNISVNTPYYRELMSLKSDLSFIETAFGNPPVTEVYFGCGLHENASELARLAEVKGVLQNCAKPLVCGYCNENGSPRYPLYTPAESPFVPFQI